MTKKDLKRIIEKARQQESQFATYGNGKPAEFKRFAEAGVEYTLVVDELRGSFLYAGSEGATVSKIEETDRCSESINLHGEKTTFASLIANDIRENEYHACVELEEDEEEEEFPVKLWYALQIDSTDAWDDGTYDRDEAVKRMYELNRELAKRGFEKTALVAVIDENTNICVDEIRE